MKQNRNHLIISPIQRSLVKLPSISSCSRYGGSNYGLLKMNKSNRNYKSTGNLDLILYRAHESNAYIKSKSDKHVIQRLIIESCAYEYIG